MVQTSEAQLPRRYAAAQVGVGLCLLRHLSKALLIEPSLVCTETNEDVKYGVGKSTEEALQLVTTGAYRPESIANGGHNVLGLAHHQVANASDSQ